MTFPLPRGICRKVCRPVRANMFARTEVVVRMATAAVRRGEDACELVSRVAVAVNCAPNPCEIEAEALSISLALAEDAAGRAIDAARELADEFSWSRGQGLRPEDDTSWWDELLARLNLIARIIRITIAVFDLLEAFLDFLDATYLSWRDARALVRCIQSRNI
jgi:hypothetical protein